ncbi:MAG: hypothetical protein ACMUJI_13845 [Erythrobacter sp.]|uniref:hypothetical protein n=1 Tax=Erythrobacter sp. TaxID=1042 RepID=UPI003A8AB0C9
MNSRLGGPPKTPWHLWVVGAIAVFWNAFGATDYTMTQLGNIEWITSMGFDEATAKTMLDFLGAAPAWADAAWALGVWGGLAGALLLLARSRFAIFAFAASIVGVIGSMIYQAGADYPPELAEMGNSPMMYIVLSIAVLLLAYSVWVQRSGVLK